MVDPVAKNNLIAAEIKPIHNPITENEKKANRNKDTTEIKEHEAHPKESEPKRQDIVKKKDAAPAAEDATRNNEPSQRDYNVEDDTVVLKIYNKKGNLINKIPPGYVTLMDKDIVDIKI